ncbi:uncharacterized protein F4812DRAFT_462428 [Daldinia caldariorum]|uniref:uncharacterized protein n=1 Tax=Daldinia caldariorum TaxID=326644 RepID=UPI0020086FB3|nr:uncharacterized protein F4812DRAFT_462428 [Daldinia caldariorum]KAI1464716.1 hypothetical protein F4812DRAFT_462428 [Daldinia caldariorum]
MSLNGLDDAKVIEAHESAVTEPGGWFLLKYANRDEVELLDRGNGGIVDIRGAIAKYEEASPLYGFLKYRRRSVLLKYQPEDCSRLVQARATVHFNAVCERFAPYDITFEISVAKDLKDSKLSAACSLHAASGSASSSSSSLRRRRLNEIAEEEEEEERERKRQSTVKEEDKRASSVYSVPASSPPTERPTVLDSQQISAPQETSFTSTVNVPEFTGADRPTSPTQSESAPRLSSQSTRPDLHSYSTYTYGKPKVKLGPRPSLETNKRPSTAENFRPTAALPAGFKLFSKGTKKGGQSHDMEQVEKTEEAEEEITLDTALTQSTPIPEVPQGTGLQLPPRPATNSGASIKSIKSTTQSLAPPPTKEAKITPEKARLMKAMKLREKKKMMKNTTTSTSEQTTQSDNPSVVETKGECDAESKDSLQIKSDAGHRAVSNADSGIAIDPPTPMTINTEDTSDSRPNSPTGATSSEIGVSTKASSLSESTHETVQASKDIREEPEEAEPKDIPGMENGLEQTKTRDTDVLDKGDTKIDQESQKIPDHPTQTTEHSGRGSVEVDDRADIVSPPSPKGNEQRNEKPSNEDDTPKSPWRVPVSKFSSHETDAPAEQKSPTTPRLKSKFSIPDISLPPEPVPALPNASVEGSKQAGGEPLLKTTSEIPLPPRSTKRRTVIGTIRTDLTKTTAHSEAHDPLLDDALMDELQSATLQEAKPMLVSKSPITPVFPNSNSGGQGLSLSRAVSNPMRGPLPVSGDVSQSSARSVSAGGAALLHSITRQSSNAGLQAKKNNLGSSISQRIKALEKLSGPPGSEDVRPKTATPSSTFFGVRRQSIRDLSRTSTVVDPTSPQAQPSSPEQFQERPPKLTGAERRERSLSVVSRLSMFEMPTQNSLRGRPDSVQVTARIVRDPNNSMPRKPEPNASADDYPQLELKQSPLVVDLQTPEPSEPIPEPAPTSLVQVHNETIQERRDKKSVPDDGEKKHRRSSLSIVKDFIKDRRTSNANKSTDNLAVMSPNGAKSPNRPPSSHQIGSSFGRRLSISSRRSSISRERDNSGSTPIGSPAVLSDSGSGDDDKKSEKKSEGRASRFMRRLSSSLSGNKKATSPHISPTVAEEDADQLATSTTDVSVSSQPTVVAYMGDVNVQFPDNLLWKRRSMSLDTEGFLFLSIVQGAAISGKDKAAATGVKRYHLSDFRAPYIPDVEIQELPNSVVLDLVEGSCLQIACEDRAGQLNILQALQDAHQKHSSFRQ